MSQSYVDVPIKIVKEVCIKHLLKILGKPNEVFLSPTNITRIKHLNQVCNYIMAAKYTQIIHLSIEDFILLWPIPSEELMEQNEYVLDYFPVN